MDGNQHVYLISGKGQIFCLKVAVNMVQNLSIDTKEGKVKLRDDFNLK